MASSTSHHVLDREFLPLRHRLLDVAAGLDRIARAGQTAVTDPRVAQTVAALKVLLEPGTDHAERVQQVFALPYEDDWREKFGLGEGQR